MQQQRHQSDAILVGVGTILADDPLLTDRSGHPRRRPLLRVILDSHLRLPLDSRLVQSVAPGIRLQDNDVLVFCSSGEEKKKRNWRRAAFGSSNFHRLQATGQIFMRCCAAWDNSKSRV